MIPQQQQQNPPVVTIGQSTPVYTGSSTGLIQVNYNGGHSTLMLAPAQTPTSNFTTSHRDQSVYVGVTLIVSGTLSIIFNIVDLVVNDEGHYNSLGFVGHGIWSGITCIIAGGFGIGAGRHKPASRCLITAFLAMCIFASLTCLAQLSVGIAGAVTASHGYCDGYYDDHCDEDEELRYVLVGMESLLAIFGLIGGIAAIWGAATCCKGGYCECGACCGACCVPGQAAPVQVVQYGMPVMCVTQQQAQPAGQAIVLGASVPTAPAYGHQTASGVQMMVHPGSVPAAKSDGGAPPAYTPEQYVYVNNI